jgi:hypothetical protein
MRTRLFCTFALVAAAFSLSTLQSADSWPGFRGPDRDDVVHGVQIATDSEVRHETSPG